MCGFRLDDKSGGNKINKPKVELNKDELNQIISFDKYVSDMNQVINQLQEDLAKNLALKISPSKK